MAEQIETIVIGGGQAGLATSFYLQQHEREHVVLEKADRPGHAWRDDRWDSFTLVTPNWGIRLPGAEYEGDDPHGFMPRDELVAYFESYVERFELPVRFGVQATAVRPNPAGQGYLVTTSDGTLAAGNVVVAAGLFQTPRIPPFSSDVSPDVEQLHSGQYRNPAALSPGAVLVVGSAQSGCQIAEELYQSGRQVYLCVGSAGRAPRRYRGHDLFDWLTLSGQADVTADKLPSPRARFRGNPHVTGKDGGHTLNLHQFARDGVVLLGHLRGADGYLIELAPDLHESLAQADKFAAELTQAVDDFIEKEGMEAPLETLPEPRDGYDAPVITELDLQAAGVSTIIWATGYGHDFSFVRLPIFDDYGFPVQESGVTEYPGLYFVGLPWLPTVKSGLLLGVAENAAHVVEDIVG